MGIKVSYEILCCDWCPNMREKIIWDKKKEDIKEIISKCVLKNRVIPVSEIGRIQEWCPLKK